LFTWEAGLPEGWLKNNTARESVQDSGRHFCFAGGDSRKSSGRETARKPAWMLGFRALRDSATAREKRCWYGRC
jgi:hypothetical protein